jgi:hypothetical protein
MTKLSDFISSHRDRFDWKENNIFAFSWAKVTRRLEFLNIIETRYRELSGAFIANSQQMHALVKPGNHPVTSEQAGLHQQGYQLTIQVHLEIEAWYLFAKIVLDDVARAIEYYFGPARGLALDSHDNLCSRIEDYAEAKSLTLSPELVVKAAELKRRISDVRDYQISHEKSPRTMQGTSWSGSGGVCIHLGRLFPKEGEMGVQTEDLIELRAELERYLDLVVACIETNGTKTRLPLEKGKSNS